MTKIAYLGAMVVPMMWMSCSDTWNEHFDAKDDTMASRGSLLEHISADASLNSFRRVVEAIGAEDMLNSPQQYTVWAPKGLTEVQADSIVQIYQTDVEAGRKWKDNRAVTQFLQNHIALYSRSVSSLTNDTVSMLNNKYMHLVGTSSTSGTLQGNAFGEATLSNNGILYKIENPMRFAPNVREYIEQNTRFDSLANFMVQFDEYVLDENSSVSGGVVDGKTVYLDSVTYLNNRILANYGYIQREDSTYMLVAPTNEVWKKEYDKFKKYFTYTTAVPNADSLSDVNTKLSIIRGRFFNTSLRSRYNQAPQDSLCNTFYSLLQQHNPRQNVYYNPFAADGILNGLTKVECSNGEVYVDTEGKIPATSTFFGRMDIPCNASSIYTVPVNATTNAETMNIANGSYEVYDTLTNELKHTYQYVQVTAKLSSEHTRLEYQIPNVLSNCYYNIYLVTAPGNLPLWFQASQVMARENGTFPTSAEYFDNPNPVTEGSVENSKEILSQRNSNRCYVSSTEKMDTILIQSAVSYPYSNLDTSDPTVKLTIQSFGPSSGSKREKIYTRTLRLNELIFIPFESKEEAEAAANDLDAFNDEKLQANKEN